MRSMHGSPAGAYAPAVVDLEDLRSFVETVQQGSFTAAARLQYVTQSSLSRRIAKLEHAVGGALFDRANRRTPRLTALGQLVLPHAQQVLTDFDRFLALTRLYSEGHSG